jgi:hypothetical protein
MEAVGSPETLVLIHQATRSHISGDENLSTHHYKNQGPLLCFKNTFNGKDLGALIGSSLLKKGLGKKRSRYS